MSLFNTYGDHNKLEQAGRSVSYETESSFWTGSDVTVRLPIYWTVTRTSSMSFSYLGMTKDAAEECARQLRSEYTRMYARWTPTVVENPGEAPTVLVNQDYVLELTSSIQPRRISGDDWGVDVSVSEKDVVITREEVKDVEKLENLFQLAEQRENTPAGGSLAITSAKWRSDVESGSIEADYSPIIPNFDYTHLGVEIRNAAGQWEAADLMLFACSKGHVEFYSPTNATFRLTYDNGSVVSGEWTTKDRTSPRFIAESATYETRYQTFESGSTRYSFESIVSLTFHEESGLPLGTLTSHRLFKIVITTAAGTSDSVGVNSIRQVGAGQFQAIGKPYQGLLQPGASAMLCFLKDDTFYSNPVSVDTVADIVIDQPVLLGHSHDHDTERSLAFKFKATFSTNLPETDVLNAIDVRCNDYILDRGAVSGTVICAKVGSKYEVSWVTDGFAAQFTYFNPNFYVRIVSGGSTHDSNLYGIRVDVAPLEIVSVTRSPGLTLSFRQNIQGFDISRITLHRYEDEEAPSAVSEGFVQVNSTVFGGNLLVTDGKDGRFRLKYTPESGDPIWSPDFANAGIVWIDLLNVRPNGDGRLIMDYRQNIPQFTDENVWIGYSKNGVVDYQAKDSSLFPDLVFNPVDGADFYFISANDDSVGGRIHYSNALAREV